MEASLIEEFKSYVREESIALDECALCRQKKELRVSHIIPRFAGKWLKGTSATGLLRGVVDPGKRLQDIGKTPLLCKDCEERLSRLETYFANEFFYPFLESEKKSFKYDSRLMRFIISLNWRTLLVSYNDFTQDIPTLSAQVDRAEESWRKYLFGVTDDPGRYEHHLFFFDYVSNGKNLPKGFQWYTLRGVDATLVGNDQRVLAYTKLPWMMFASSIHPTKLEGWESTRIEDSGEISQPQSIKDGSFGSFFIDRSQLLYGKIPSRSSGGVDTRILKTIEKRPGRYLESQSLEVSLAEAKRAREIRKESMSRLIKELIWIIEGALEDTSLTKAERQRRKLGLSILADTLTRISDKEAVKLESLIESTIKKSKNLGKDVKCVFATAEFVVVFIVNLYSTKNEQRSQVAAELDKLRRNSKVNDKRHLMVFSWNPFEPDLPYESAFFIS